MISWMFPKQAVVEVKQVSDWEKIWTQASSSYDEGAAAWSKLSLKIEEVSSQSFSKQVSEKVNQVVRALPWVMGALLCPAVLVLPALSSYIFLSVKFGPFSEEYIKNSANGVGVACVVSALSRFATIPNPLSFMIASVYTVAAFFLLKRGGLLNESLLIGK